MSLIAKNVFPKITHLGNGLTVATVPVASELSAVGYYVRSGSIYETEKENGVAHFLEHILFRGNERYSRQNLEDFADKKGISLQATTSRTITSFFAHVARDQVQNAVDILSQIVLKPKITSRAVDDERETILEEDQTVKRDINEVLWDQLHAVCYKDSPLGRPILGTPETIKTITAQMIENHHRKFFHPSNCVFVCATPLDHGVITDYVLHATRHMKFPQPFDVKDLDKKIPVDFSGRTSVFGSPLLDDSWIALGHPSPSILDPHFYCASLVRTALDNYDIANPYTRSPLLKNKEFITRLSGYNFVYGSTALTAYLGTAKGKSIQEWSTSLFEGILEATRKPNQETLDMAKRRLKWNIAHGMASVHGVLDELGQSLIVRGHWISPEQHEELIDMIRPEDIEAYGHRFLHEKPWAGVIITPATMEEIERTKK